jgi:hypothetical protein
MVLRNDQHMAGIHWSNVHESGAKIIAVNEIGWGESRKDVTEDAGGHFIVLQLKISNIYTIS